MRLSRGLLSLSSDALPYSTTTRRVLFFFFNDTATTEIYTSVHTPSLHDALPISSARMARRCGVIRIPRDRRSWAIGSRSEEHTSELQVTNAYLVCRLLLEKKKNKKKHKVYHISIVSNNQQIKKTKK